MVEPFLLKQNRHLSAAETARALDQLKSVRAIEEDRVRFVTAHALDPEFCLPGGNYGGPDLRSARPDTDLYAGPGGYLRLVGHQCLDKPESLAWLRFLSKNFSGFSLRHYRRTEDLPRRRDPADMGAPAPDFDAMLPARLANDTYVVHWQHLLKLTPFPLLFMPPPICGEIGWNVSGIIVNHDTAVYQERLTLLFLLGITRFLEQTIAERGFARVLEIGGGYGAIARQIKHSYRNVAYTICDLPEALYSSAAYLALALPDLDLKFVLDAGMSTDALNAIHFIPNHALPVAIGDRAFDLIINTLSMSEMAEPQVRTYGEIISRLIGHTGLFFEQNFDNSHVGMLDCKKILPASFSFRADVRSVPIPLSQGPVTVWSNHPMELPYSVTSPCGA